MSCFEAVNQHFFLKMIWANNWTTLMFKSHLYSIYIYILCNVSFIGKMLASFHVKVN